MTVTSMKLPVALSDFFVSLKIHFLHASFTTSGSILLVCTILFPFFRFLLSPVSMLTFICIHLGHQEAWWKETKKKVFISYVPPSFCIILIFFLIYFIQEICTVDLFVFWDWSANIDEISNLDIRTVREPSKSFLLLPPLSQTPPYIFLLQPVPSRTVYNKNNNSWIYKVKFCEC